jgi:hypothetical protein
MALYSRYEMNSPSSCSITESLGGAALLSLGYLLLSSEEGTNPQTRRSGSNLVDDPAP